MIKRRICFPFIGRTIGGSHHSTLLLAKNLDPQRYEALIVLHEEGPLAALVRQYELDYTVLPLPFLPLSVRECFSVKGLSIYKALQHLAKFIQKNDINIVHLDDGPLYLLWRLALAMQHDKSKKYVHYQRTPLKSCGFSKKIALKSYDRILCNSYYTQSTLPPSVRKRSRVLYPPVMTDGLALSRRQCSKALRRQYNIPADHIVIGFLGNLQARKHPQIVPDIAKIIRDRHIHNFTFVMAGNAYDEAAQQTCEKIKSYGLEKHVICTGFVSEPMVFLSGCDILIAPAENEAFGRTLVEAMICGALVIAADKGGHREIVRDGENGLLVPLDSAEEFAVHIMRYITQPGYYDRLIEEAYTAAAAHYNIKAHTERMMLIYDDLYQ